MPRSSERLPPRTGLLSILWGTDKTVDPGQAPKLRPGREAKDQGLLRSPAAEAEVKGSFFLCQVYDDATDWYSEAANPWLSEKQREEAPAQSSTSHLVSILSFKIRPKPRGKTRRFRFPLLG